MKKLTVWVSPKGKTWKTRYYELLLKSAHSRVIRGDEERVFLPAWSYPKRRGRKPKWRVLWVAVGGREGIDPATAERIYSYLSAVFPDRDVLFIFYQHGERSTRDEETGLIEWGKYYGYVLPWWSLESGRVIPNKIGFFRDLRRDILTIAQGGHVEARPFWEWEPRREAPQEEVPGNNPMRGEKSHEERPQEEAVHVEGEAPREESATAGASPLERGLKAFEKDAKEDNDVMKAIEDLDEIISRGDRARKEREIAELETALQGYELKRKVLMRDIEKYKSDIARGFLKVSAKRKLERTRAQVHEIDLKIRELKARIRKLKREIGEG